MNLIQAIILGIVQGLTEYLPISSTAHVRILPALLGWPDPGAAFTAMIQLGTLLAVLIYFWNDLIRAFVGWCKGLRGGEAARTVDAKMGWAIFIGTLPIVIFGVAFKDQIENELRSLQIIAWSLIVMGLLLYAAEKVGKQQRQITDVTWKDGLIVGVWQAMALIPGCSRSGSTITGGLFAGFERATAARFSFLMSVPSILAAGVFAIVQHRESMGTLGMPVLVANVASFISGYAAIAFLMKFLQTRSVTVFTVYRVILGVAILALIQVGMLDPLAGLATAETPVPSVTSGAP